MQESKEEDLEMSVSKPNIEIESQQQVKPKISFKTEFRRETRIAMLGSLTVVTGLAWNNLFTQISSYFAESYPVLSSAISPVIITIVCAGFALVVKTCTRDSSSESTI